MLFLHGSRDKLAELERLTPLIEELEFGRSSSSSLAATTHSTAQRGPADRMHRRSPARSTPSLIGCSLTPDTRRPSMLARQDRRLS